MDIFLPVATAFLITTIFVPLTIKIAHKYGLMDSPKYRLHPARLHTKNIPRAGGLPIYMGIVLCSLLFLPVEKYILGIFIGITILLLTGLLDDKLHKFNPYLRLGLVFLAAGAAVASGTGISFITNPLAAFSSLPGYLTTPIIQLDQIIIPINFFGIHKIVLLADLFALFWIATLTQIINWSKGVDGQMPTITLTTAIILGLLSLKFYGLGDPTQLNVAKLSFITAGASFGFLIFNWHPAKIFPGFSGSTILAYMLAILAILAGAKVMAALLVLAIPTIDFVYTFWRRILSGHSPVWGDRGHLHHKLIDLGWSHQKISLFYGLGSVMLGGVTLLLDTKSKLFAIFLVAIVFVGFVLWISSFYEKKE